VDLSRTGIRERHVVDKGVATSDLATERPGTLSLNGGSQRVTWMLLSLQPLRPTCSSLPPPAWSSTKLGAEGVWGLISPRPCSAFLYALQTGAQFVATGAHQESPGDWGRHHVLHS